MRCRRAVLNSSPMRPSFRRKTRKSYLAVAGLKSRRLLLLARALIALALRARANWM